jgi:hypothetical protein
MQWHVSHTKVREEFRAFEDHQNQGIKVFLPICQFAKFKKITRTNKNSD